MTHRVGRFAAPLAIAAAILLNACGGSGSGPLPVPNPSPTNNPGSNLKTASVSVTMDLPGTSSAARRTSTRHAQYIDETNSTQLVITVASVNGVALHQTTSYSFSSGSNCTGSNPPVCTYSTLLPVGNDIIQFTLEDTNNRPLAQSVVTANITQGSNNIQTTLNGIVATLNAATCGVATFQSDGEHIPVTWGQSTGNAAANDVDQTISYKTGYGVTASVVTATGLGAFAATGTYKYIVLFRDSSGNALGQSNEVSVNVTDKLNQNVTITPQSGPAGVSTFDVFRTAAGGANNSETVVATGVAWSPGTYTDTGTSTGSGSLGPTSFIGTPGQYAATAASDSTQSLNPLTISSTNPNAKFSVNGAAAANPATIKGAADNVVLIYSGSQIAGTAIPITIGASVPNSVPGNSQITQVTSNACVIASNSSVIAPPQTSVSVTNTGNWVLQNGYGSGQQSNPYNVDCFAPPSSSSITINDAQCYYTTSGSLTSFTGSSTGIQYVMRYTGSVLLNYWTTSLQTQASMSGTYYFVDTNNPSNTFTGVLSGTFKPTTAPTNASNGQLNASLESAANSTTTWTFTITGTGGAFAGVNGTLTIATNAFTNSRDTNYPQQFDYSNITMTGTLNGI